MKEQINSVENCGKRENLKIWHCESCRSFHFRVGEILLTFSPKEFVDFSAVIGELYGKAAIELLREENEFDELGLVA